MRHHRGGQIGMRVQAGADRDVAGHGAEAAQQLALRIAEALRHHSAMQFQVDRVERPLRHRLLQVVQQQRRHALESLGGDGAGGAGGGPAQRRHGDALRLGGADGAGGGEAGRADHIQHRGGPQQWRRPARRQEIRPGRGARREGMAFVLEAADGDAHDPQPLATPAVASTASASTLAPASAHSGVMLSSSLWLMPPWQGTQTKPVGSFCAT